MGVLDISRFFADGDAFGDAFAPRRISIPVTV
jgi:hypothetical protein